MNTVFVINFRREAYLREVAKARTRAAMLGVWVLYFGALGIVLGLYALNAFSFAQGTVALERRVERLRHRGSFGTQWRPARAEVDALTHDLHDLRAWRDRLERLPELVPSGAQLTALQFNPDNVSGAAETKLVLTGRLRAGGGTDRMQQVMSFVTALAHDPVFSAGYPNIRLVTTRASSTGDAADFVIECR